MRPEISLIQADESTYKHGGADWSTVVHSCRIRLSVAGILLVGIPQVEPLVRMVLAGGQ